MWVFDAHCDALMKLWQHPDLSFAHADERLQASLPDLEKGSVRIQTFAVFVPTEVAGGETFHVALQMIDLFYRQVAAAGMEPILSRTDLHQTVLNRRKGAILFVEGADPLEASITKLRTLYRLGVRGMGLTWNHRNAVADGCMEPRPGGLSRFGRTVLEEMNRLGMIVDVSHLAEPGFWDVLEQSQFPVIASHSNTKKWCNHPRNLSDEQIQALIRNNGVMGLTFVPFFTTGENRQVRMDDLLRHLEHVCALGGVDHVGFGSDFDGITETYADLSRARHYHLLMEALLKRYKEEEAEKFLHGNWLRVFQSVLKY